MCEYRSRRRSENDFLLKGVVEQEAKIVQASLKQHGESHENKQRDQTFGVVTVDNVIKNIFRRRRRNGDHECARDRASQRRYRKQRVAF